MTAAITDTGEMIMRCFQQWGWLAGLRARGAETLFVTDADIAAALHNKLGAQGPQIVVAGQHKGAALDGVTEVIFFCRQRERAYARKMAMQYPNLTVSSATYDYLPLGVLEGRFECKIPPATAEKKAINLVISGPSAGAEDLIDLLQANKVCLPQTFMTHALACWAELQTDFQPVRYLRGVRGCFDEYTVDLFLETDVLSRIIEKTSLPWDKFFIHIENSPMRVLYFTRRAKVAQALALARSRGMPSSVLLDDDTDTKALTTGVKPDLIDAWIAVLLKLEITIEKAMLPIAKLKNVTLEDLHGAPDNVLPDVGDFFKRGVRKKRDYSPIVRAMNEQAELAPHIAQHSKRLIDHLGLSVSNDGSFVSITNEILTD